MKSPARIPAKQEASTGKGDEPLCNSTAQPTEVAAPETGAPVNQAQHMPVHIEEEDLAKLRQELAQQKDRYLRLAADFDNFKKRTAQETERRAARQKEEFIRDLLPVIDNLERALAVKSSAAEQLCSGVEMTVQQLHQLLRQHGFEADVCIGQPFEPRQHEAVASRCDSSKPDHVILEVFQRGYRRGDDVFRPAKVVVNDLNAKAPSCHAG